MFEAARRDGVLRVAAPGARWLSSGFDGGFGRADAAYNVTVPEGFDRTDLAAFVDERRAAAGFPELGPALLTGVSQRHARGARAGSVTAYVTTGLSNPAALPMDPGAVDAPAREHDRSDDPPRPGTVNVVVGTTHALDGGGLAGLLATAVEAKTATLSAVAGFPGTTSDAVIVGCPVDGEAGDAETEARVGTEPDLDRGPQPAAFAGSATPVGEAARVCVRDALRASFESRYGNESAPGSVEEARYGTVTTRESSVFTPGE